MPRYCCCGQPGTSARYGSIPEHLGGSPGDRPPGSPPGSPPGGPAGAHRRAQTSAPRQSSAPTTLAYSTTNRCSEIATLATVLLPSRNAPRWISRNPLLARSIAASDRHGPLVISATSRSICASIHARTASGVGTATCAGRSLPSCTRSWPLWPSWPSWHPSSWAEQCQCRPCCPTGHPAPDADPARRQRPPGPGQQDVSQHRRASRLLPSQDPSRHTAGDTAHEHRPWKTPGGRSCWPPDGRLTAPPSRHSVQSVTRAAAEPSRVGESHYLGQPSRCGGALGGRGPPKGALATKEGTVAAVASARCDTLSHDNLPCPSASDPTVRLRRLLLPAHHHRARGALVAALGPVLPRRRGAARRTRSVGCAVLDVASELPVSPTIAR